MDETLNLKTIEFRKALATLEELLKQGVTDDAVLRDAAVQRFEYSFELCWKSCKEWLRAVHGVDVFSPKDCFRELRRLQVISEAEAELYLQMTDDRNTTVHTYDEVFIQSLALKLDHYFRHMKKLLTVFG